MKHNSTPGVMGAQAPADALRQAAEQFVASCKDGNAADLIDYYEEIFAEALGVEGRCHQTFCAQTPIPSPMDYEGEG